ncbi:MAG: 23S rRNA (uracil(1939)-C(5))-methyltransferase RlmD [Candidatus Xenobium sp.]
MPEPLAIGSRVRVTIHDLAAGGEAVGRVDNFVIFVPGGAPGDELEVQLTELKKNYGRARICRVFKPSIRRIVPRCPIYTACGGCQFQHIDYDSQLQFKTKMVEDALQHIAGLESVRVHPCRRMKSPWQYRDKVQAVVAAKPYLPTGSPDARRFRPYVGFYAQGTHKVVKVEDCAIQGVLNNQVLVAAREALERLQWPVYDEKEGTGLVRYLVVRSSRKAQEAILVVVSAQPRLPQVQEFVDMVRKRVRGLRGVLLNLNPHRSNVILGTRNQLLWGADHLVEEVRGLKFHISPSSFFQVNIGGLEAIYDVMDEYLDPKPRDIILDAYCGVGSLALHLARKAKRVVGIDETQSAIEDAVINSDLNDLANTDFMAGTVERILPGMYQKGVRFQSAVLDPPRKGCDPVVLDTLVKMRIPHLLYVSCNPSTLARDLGALAYQGYRTLDVQPIDMFPQTFHVECVARVTRK